MRLAVGPIGNVSNSTDLTDTNRRDGEWQSWSKPICRWRCPTTSLWSRHGARDTSTTVRWWKCCTGSVSGRHESEHDEKVKRGIRLSHYEEHLPSPLSARKHVGIAQQLYIGKYQCRLCGLRFTAKLKQYYTHHLDWHYLENKQEKDLVNTSTSTTLLQRSRPWYASVQEWTTYEENIEEQIRTEKLLAAQKPSNQAPQPTAPGSEHLLASSEIVSCPASSNGDVDDDVSSNSASYSLHRSALFSSDAIFAMIHLRISSTTIEKNGIWKTPCAKMERLIIQSAIKMFLPELQTRWAKISPWFAFQVAKNILCRESSPMDESISILFTVRTS